MKRNSLTAVTPAGPGTPDAENSLDHLDNEFSRAHATFYAAKSIPDLLTRYDLTRHADEVIFAIEELLYLANERFNEVARLLAKLRSQEQRAKGEQA
jgi:hypothetical protein